MWGKSKNIFNNLILFIIISSILLLTVNVSLAEKPSDVKLDYFVNDYANILTQEQEDAIADELIPLFNNNTAQISVVTINSLDGLDINSFAYQVAEGKLGDKEKNNGLLILISVQDKKYRFEVGRGLEQYLNDAKVGRIGRDFLVPYFKQGDYYTGIYSSVKSIRSIIEKNVTSDYYVSEKNNNSTKVLIILFVIFFIIIIISGFSEQNTNKNFQKSNSKKNNDDIFTAAVVLSQILKGGGGRGGGSGGFGGFGGGSFGGGGAGGGW